MHLFVCKLDFYIPDGKLNLICAVLKTKSNQVVYAMSKPMHAKVKNHGEGYISVVIINNNNDNDNNSTTNSYCNKNLYSSLILLNAFLTTTRQKSQWNVSKNSWAKGTQPLKLN